ncbi:MAG: type VI secretion system membrane subunit TssM, partial [Pseudomonadales bacterium]|nr:type VI secretion system membrane subunit TssM [Pseudomonadales bacterium]
REIMFPEAGIVGLNRGFERKLKVIRAISISLMAVFTLATIGVWASSLIQNKRLMSEVTEKITEHETAVQASFGSNYDMEKVDAVLKPLDEATQIYTELSAPWLSSLGMYDGSVPESATKAYYSGLQQYYIPALAYRLQTILTTTKDDEELYNALRVYLMLGDKSRLEPEALTRWFSDDWLQEYQGKAALQGELKGFLADALTHGYQPINYNTVVLEQARNKAREVPIERRIYNQIRNHPEYSRLIDLELEVGRSLKAAFNDTSNGSRLKVPFLFTKAGYDKLDLSKDSELVRKFASEQWVVGTETTEDFTDKDIENIAEKVKTLYLAEYTETWKSALTTLRVKSFANMNDARTILKTLTSTTDSPLVRFLNIASNQTSLTPRLAQLASKSNAANSNSAAIGGAVAALQENALPPTQVDKEFSKLHDLIDTNALESVVRKLESLSEMLEGFALSPSQQAAAFDFAKGRFQGAGDDPIRGLLVESNQSPNPLKGWLGAIADESWKVVLGNSKAHLNQAWNSRVYQPFKASLGSRYPFSGASGDVALADFTEFFKPGGIEESFIKEFLTPFISTSKNWSPKSLNGRSIGISGAALTQIKRADTIRKVFFRKDASAASVDFTLTPTRMDSSVRRFELRFGETRVRYSHGPKLPVSLSWPGEGDNSIRLLFEDINETLRDANYTGDWALFKVLDSATVKKANQANTFFATFDVEGRKVDYQIKANSFLNPFQSSWMRLYSCPTSL